MIPRIIHQTCKELTSEEERLAIRLRAVLRNWEYRLWTDEDNEALVRERFPQYVSIFRSITYGVVKADLARYMYMSVYGGFYFDTDYKVVRTIDAEMLNQACVLPISRNCDSLFRLGNAVIGSEPNHPLWTDFLAYLFSDVQMETLAESTIEKTTGPEGLTDFVMQRRSLYQGIFFPHREVFRPPVSYSGFYFERQETTIGAHLSWGS